MNGMSITSERLQELRKARGYSQQDVAKLIGVGRTTYLKYESGDNRPTRKLNELARLFNVSADYLLGLTDTPADPTPAQPPAQKEDREHKHLQDLLSDPHLRRILESSGQLSESSLQEVQNFIDFQLGKKKQ